MVPPKNAKIYDWESSTFWIDEDGILCSVQKKTNHIQTLNEVKETINKFNQIFGSKKFCMLADATNTSESSKEVRDFAAQEFPKMFKALAYISSSPLGKMLGNLFFAIKKQPYPSRMFNNEKEAKEWLKQYL